MYQVSLDYITAFLIIVISRVVLLDVHKVFNLCVPLNVRSFHRLYKAVVFLDNHRRFSAVTQPATGISFLLA